MVGRWEWWAVSIEFHCEHCSKAVKAPADAGGHRGKCPHCKGTVYVPLPEEEDEGELSLAPLDPVAEQARRDAMRESAAQQAELLRDTVAPGKRRPPARGAGSTRGAAGSGKLSVKAMNTMTVAYVEAMARGDLARASSLAAQLSKDAAPALRALESMLADDLAGYGMPSLPRPVLMGFLTQLRRELGG